jgi:hypothetical protein
MTFSIRYKKQICGIIKALLSEAIRFCSTLFGILVHSETSFLQSSQKRCTSSTNFLMLIIDEMLGLVWINSLLLISILVKSRTTLVVQFAVCTAGTGVECTPIGLITHSLISSSSVSSEQKTRIDSFPPPPHFPLLLPAPSLPTPHQFSRSLFTVNTPLPPELEVSCSSSPVRDADRGEGEGLAVV